MGKLNWISSFEDFANGIFSKYKVPGAAVGVAKDGELIYERGFGHRNVEKSKEVTNDTIFGIASITKSFTGVAIMQLQEAGKLAVDDKVITYLPNLILGNEKHTRQITIHHLLTHTAGLPPLPTLYHAMRRTMEEDSSVSEKQRDRLLQHDPIDNNDQLIKFLSELQIDLLGDPGTQFSYSNDSYALLGAIIEQVSGQRYDEYVTENILKPVGMKNSTFDLNIVLSSPKATTIYATTDSDGEKEVYASDTWWDSKAMYAGGFLRSTLDDMMRYTEIFRNSGQVGDIQILKAESVKTMIHPHVQFQENKFYGYGLMITPNYNGGTLVEHGGSLKGVSSNFGVIPEKGLASVVLTNLVGVPAFKLMVAAFNAIQELAPETPLSTYDDYELSSEDYKKYVASFESGEGAEMSVVKEDHQLYFQSEGKSYQMRPVGEHLFTINMNESETPIRFLFNNEGDLSGLFLGVRQILKQK
ncbi:serine hydrolase domain-containing protein [Evansella cellulosilytica]|uniref:Beta-lactamase n=1 Tax=Evansella cellulosilytica (strain ATCC 21833 / DSM 2522 / FERM P-1141 / JCM 9156 / N-4) TaxID=649639 RepID=E6TW63_EVAC2|nr:serine hydrolase domain-containing protein [Evansella cellulosilytica]ADU31019.1 beta-lactamase [Evansella cellulosilytica DSM 2522]